MCDSDFLDLRHIVDLYRLYRGVVRGLVRYLSNLTKLRYRLCSSREGHKSVRCAQQTHALFDLSGAPECHPSFVQTARQKHTHARTRTHAHTHTTHTHTQHSLSHNKHTHTHTHTHTCVAGVLQMGQILVVFMREEAQVPHTHICPHGANKCDCMLAHH